LDSLIARARSQFAKIRENDTANALRGLFLGMLFFEIKNEAGQGNFMRVADTRMPEICRSVRNDMMALARIFTDEEKIALPPQFAIPDAQTALQLTGDAVTEEIVRAAVKFIGDLSLHALMAKWEVRDKKLLGGARPGAEKDTRTEEEKLTELREKVRLELGAWLASGRQLLITENCCQYLSGAEEIEAFHGQLLDLKAEFTSAIKPLLKGHR